MLRSTVVTPSGRSRPRRAPRRRPPSAARGPRSPVVGARAAQPDHHPGWPRVDGLQRQAAHSDGRAELAELAAGEVDPRGLGALDVRRVADRRDRRRHLVPCGASVTTASSSPPSGRATSTKPGPAVGHRRQHDLVVVGAWRRQPAAIASAASTAERCPRAELVRGPRAPASSSWRTRRSPRGDLRRQPSCGSLVLGQPVRRWPAEVHRSACPAVRVTSYQPPVARVSGPAAPPVARRRRHRRRGPRPGRASTHPDLAGPATEGLQGDQRLHGTERRRRSARKNAVGPDAGIFLVEAPVRAGRRRGSCRYLDGVANAAPRRLDEARLRPPRLPSLTSRSRNGPPARSTTDRS